MFNFYDERGVESTKSDPVAGTRSREQAGHINELGRRPGNAILSRCPQYIFTNVNDGIDYFALRSADPRFPDYRFVCNASSYRIYRNLRCG